MSLLRPVRLLPGLLRQCTRVATVHQQRMGYAAEGQMSFTFASPSEVFYNQQSVKQVDVPSFSGSFGILPSHVPSLAVLKPGIVTIIEDDGSTKKVFVSSGSITINGDSSVQILAEEACSTDKLDAASIRDGLSKAQSAVNTASGEEAKAEAMIELEAYEALQKAVE